MSYYINFGWYTIPFTFLLLILVSIPTLSQETELDYSWRWVQGDRASRAFPIQGTWGVRSEQNHPSNVVTSMGWVDLHGNCWYLNETAMWRYEPEVNIWTWFGSQEKKRGIYTEEGEFAPKNFPGPRSEIGATWVDREGFLWLFGGHGRDIKGLDGELADLWKYNVETNQWAFVRGPSHIRSSPIYPPKGTSTSQATPGGRYSSTSGHTPDGKFWMFGGTSRENDYEKIRTHWNDLWILNPSNAEWQWVAGSTEPNQPSIYTGDNASPSARISAQGWCDQQGRLWLFGGYGLGGDGKIGAMNDLWMFNFDNLKWTWIGGDTVAYSRGRYDKDGSAGTTAWPRSRHHGVMWEGKPDLLFLFGGGSRPPTHTTHHRLANASVVFNDLWTYNIKEQTWTWLRGDSLENSEGHYTLKGLARTENEAGSRTGAIWWIDHKKRLRMHSGYGKNHHRIENVLYGLSNQELYDPTTNMWTWVEGHRHLLAHITDDPLLLEFPGEEVFSRGWLRGSDSLFLFDPFHREVWLYQPSTSKWQLEWKVPNAKQFVIGDLYTAYDSGYGNYGTKGIPTSQTYPGMRSRFAQWTDKNGNYWIFGGRGVSTQARKSPDDLIDIWKYDVDSKLWTWMGDIIHRRTDTTPGYRSSSAHWTTQDGDLILFGGWSSDLFLGAGGYRNDLWRLDTRTLSWTMIQDHVYSGALIAQPEVRSEPLFCQDQNENFFMYGGAGVDNKRYSDLWMYSMTDARWELLSDNVELVYPKPIYGEKYTFSDSIHPGYRKNALLWVDSSGQIYLHGGEYYRSRDSIFYYNDTWTFNRSSRQWAWISGDNLPLVRNTSTSLRRYEKIEQRRILTGRNIPHPDNRPGILTTPPYWFTNDQILWMFDGVNLWNQSRMKLSEDIVVDAGSDVVICSGDSVEIGKNGSTLYHYQWSDGAGTEPVVTVSPQRTRRYYLAAFDSTKQKYAIDSMLVTVLSPPSALFSIELTADVVQFSPVASSVHYHWSFGDGEISTEATPIHRYRTPGSYQTTLIVTGDCGSDTSSFRIEFDKNLSVPMEPHPSIDFNVVVNSIDNYVVATLSIEQRSKLDMRLFDNNGKEHIVILDETKAPGHYSIPLNLNDLHLSSGKYWLRLKTEDVILSRAITILR